MVSGRDLISTLECGVENWNAFRRQNPGSVMLNGACLANANLVSIDLRRGFLMESDLRRANLSCANLKEAILRKADLRDSDLRNANLSGADLCRADLSGADLRDANLESAFLKRTDLCGADLSTTLGLTDAQISGAFGDGRTRLPTNLARPASWAA